jgi:hypothetical protein
MSGSNADIYACPPCVVGRKLSNKGDKRNVGNGFATFAAGIVVAVLIAAIFAALLLLSSQFVGLSGQ